MIPVSKQLLTSITAANLTHLTDEDLAAVMLACRDSDLFSAKEKRRFFY